MDMDKGVGTDCGSEWEAEQKRERGKNWDTVIK